MVGPGHDVITVEMVGGGAGIQVPTQLFLPCALSLRTLFEDPLTGNNH